MEINNGDADGFIHCPGCDKAPCKCGAIQVKESYLKTYHDHRQFGTVGLILASIIALLPLYLLFIYYFGVKQEGG